MISGASALSICQTPKPSCGRLWPSLSSSRGTFKRSCSSGLASREEPPCDGLGAARSKEFINLDLFAGTGDDLRSQAGVGYATRHPFLEIGPPLHRSATHNDMGYLPLVQKL